jgi:hypothetical protein
LRQSVWALKSVQAFTQWPGGELIKRLVKNKQRKISFFVFSASLCLCVMLKPTFALRKQPGFSGYADASTTGVVITRFSVMGKVTPT